MPVPVLTRRELHILDRLIREADANRGSVKEPTAPDNSLRTYVVYMPEDVRLSARNGDTVAHGEFDLYEFSDTSGLEAELVPVLDGNDNPRKVRVYNLSDLETPRDRYVIVKQERYTGRFVYDGLGHFGYYEMIEDLIEGATTSVVCYPVKVGTAFCGETDRYLDTNGDPQQAYICPTFFTGVALGIDPPLDFDPAIHDVYRGDIVLGFSQADGTIVAFGTGRSTARFELQENLLPGAEVDAWRLFDDYERVPEGPAPDEKYTITTTETWQGIAFGYESGFGAGATDGDVVTCVWSGGQWRAVGAGHTILSGTFVEATGQIRTQVHVGHNGQVQQHDISISTACGTQNGDEIVAVWIDDEFQQLCEMLDPGCGLEIVAGAIAVDNDTLAGTGLDVEGTCALRVHQDVLDDITQLQTDVAANGAAIAAALAAISDLADDVYANAQAIEACCSGKSQVDVVYSVTCVDGDIVYETQCIYVQGCA